MEAEENDLVDTTLLEQKKQLKRKIANQRHIAEVAELQQKYDAMLTGTGVTTKQSLNVNSVNIDASRTIGRRERRCWRRAGSRCNGNPGVLDTGGEGGKISRLFWVPSAGAY